MKKFIVPCFWAMYGEFEVEANSLEEAIAQVANPSPSSPYNGLPPDPEYIDCSFEIGATELCEELNATEQETEDEPSQ